MYWLIIGLLWVEFVTCHFFNFPVVWFVLSLLLVHLWTGQWSVLSWVCDLFMTMTCQWSVLSWVCDLFMTMTVTCQWSVLSEFVTCSWQWLVSGLFWVSLWLVHDNDLSVDCFEWVCDLFMTMTCQWSVLSEFLTCSLQWLVSGLFLVSLWLVHDNDLSVVCFELVPCSWSSLRDTSLSTTLGRVSLTESHFFTMSYSSDTWQNKTENKYRVKTVTMSYSSDTWPNKTEIDIYSETYISRHWERNFVSERITQCKEHSKYCRERNCHPLCFFPLSQKSLEGKSKNRIRKRKHLY